MNAERRTSVVVTGMGMRTAIGNTLPQSCASARAAISRFREWPYFNATAGEEEEEEGGGIAASAIAEDLGDDCWIEKVVDLLWQPIHEAIWQSRHMDLFESGMPSTTRLGIYLATPYTDRAERLAARVEASAGGSAPDEEQDEGADEEPDTESDADTDTDEIAEVTDEAESDGETQEDELEPSYDRFVEQMEELFHETFDPVTIKLFPQDHAAGLMAVAHAVHDLSSDQVDTALVAGVDSLLEADCLASLYELGMLKTDGNSCGLIPGEAGAVLVLERAETAAARQVTPLSRIAATSMGQEAAESGDGVAGAELTRVLRSVIESVGGTEGLYEVYVDLNGERARFLDWALVETRCMHEFPRGWRLQHPADCLGDIGAAFGIVAVALATQSFVRGYARGRGVVICSSSRDGERSAACVMRVES